MILKFALSGELRHEIVMNVRALSALSVSNARTSGC